MQEKHKDLKSTKQRIIVKSVVDQLAQAHPDFYYLSTIELAAEIKAYMHDGKSLVREDFDEVASLSRHDIQMLLSLHHQ